MKGKNFQSYLEKRFDKKEITKIEQQAKLELKILKSLQKDIITALNSYMKKNDIGFNDIVKQLNVSPTHISKIQKSKANLTLASIAHFSALIGEKPRLVFGKK